MQLIDLFIKIAHLINIFFVSIIDAVALNFQPSPHRDEFFKEISEGVRFGKQRMRNVNVGKGIVAETGIRQRKRENAQRNLLGQQENSHNLPLPHAAEENAEEEKDAEDHQN